MIMESQTREAPELEGWVRQRHFLGFWIPKFATLVGDRLHIAKHETSPKAGIEVVITESTHIEVPDAKTGGRFTILNPGTRPIHLQAASDSERLNWVLALRTCTLTRVRYCMDDFRIISVIGRGFYGKVMLCEHNVTKERVAIKSIRKTHLLETGKMQSMVFERSILAKLDHPFIVSLKFAFQTSAKFYLGLEYAPGGELFHRVSRRGLPSLEVVRLYMAEIALALNYLHSKGIVYRDLKPENLVLDAEGHVKLTDFGLAKEISHIKQTQTFCGTAEYIAPEMVRRCPHGFAVDWWASGVLLYELVCGSSPFFDDHRWKLWKKILQDEVECPPDMDPGVKEYIEMTLVKDPLKRAGFREIQNCRLFQGLDWEAVRTRRVNPKEEFASLGLSHFDNFDDEFTQEPARDSICGDVFGSWARVEGFSCDGFPERRTVRSPMVCIEPEMAGIAPSNFSEIGAM
jgi:serine/threonine protein kinase